MEWAAFFGVFQAWGPSAVSSVLVIVVVHLIRKIDADAKKDEQRAKDLRDYINSSLNNFGTRISVVEHEYLKRETFYRELGGWKEDINGLSSQVSTQFFELNRNIIELWKDKRDQ